MDSLGNPLTIRPIQTGWEFTIEPYVGWRFGFIDGPGRQFDNGLAQTWTWTWSDISEPLLTLVDPDFNNGAWSV